MRTLITKQQIGQYVTLSQNISDLDVNQYISDVQEYDIINVLPQALIDAIAGELNTVVEWTNVIAFTTGQFTKITTTNTATPDDVSYYTALAPNTGSQPPSANWEDNELLNFYQSFLVPLMSQEFYYRFIAEHGQKVTQAGLVQVTDATYDAVSDTSRAVKLGGIKSKVNVWINKINKELQRVNWTFDTVQYLPEDGKNKRVKQGVRIYALGGRNRNCRGYKSIGDIC